MRKFSYHYHHIYRKYKIISNLFFHFLDNKNRKLIDVLQTNIKEAVEPKEKSVDGIEIDERIEVKRLYKTTRYLHYVMKFIIRSRILYSAINDNSDHDDFATKLHGNMIYFSFFSNSNI